MLRITPLFLHGKKMPVFHLSRSNKKDQFCMLYMESFDSDRFIDILILCVRPSKTGNTGIYNVFLS